MKTVSLELAQKLKKAGYNETSAFYYWRRGTQEWQLDNAKNLYTEDKAIVAAPSADEILNLLPPRIQFKKKVTKNPDWSIDFIPDNELEELKHAGFLTIANPDRWVVNYHANACFGLQNMAKVFYDDNRNLANAAAKCWLYLKKHNYIDNYE